MLYASRVSTFKVDLLSPLFIFTLTPCSILVAGKADYPSHLLKSTHMPTAIHSSTQHESNHDENLVAESDSDSIPTHPLGVKPLGNQYLTERPNSRRNIGLWRSLPDELLMIILESFDEPSLLLKLGYSCKFFFAFCHLEDLWKTIFLQ